MRLARMSLKDFCLIILMLSIPPMILFCVMWSTEKEPDVLPEDDEDREAILLFQQQTREIGFNEEETSIVQMLLAKLVMVAKENDIDFFLYSGTLLGMYRYGGPLPWDDDVDVMLSEGDRPKLVEAWSKLGPSFDSFLWENNNTTKLFSTEKFTVVYGGERRYNYPYIDVFTYSREGDHIVMYDQSWKKVYIHVDDVFPLKSAEFMGVAGVFAPRNVVKFLEVYFGPKVFEECMMQYWDHGRERHARVPRLTTPCDKLDKWLRVDLN